MYKLWQKYLIKPSPSLVEPYKEPLLLIYYCFGMLIIVLACDKIIEMRQLLYFQY